MHPESWIANRRAIVKAATFREGDSQPAYASIVVFVAVLDKRDATGPRTGTGTFFKVVVARR